MFTHTFTNKKNPYHYFITDYFMLPVSLLRYEASNAIGQYNINNYWNP